MGPDTCQFDRRLGGDHEWNCASSSVYRGQLPWATGQMINGASPSIWYGNSYGRGDHVGRDFWAIDFNMPNGTLVTPVANGIAHVSDTVCGGYSVWIDRGGGFSSYYGHLNGPHILVSEGQAVTQGQTVIAWSDDSGDHNSAA